MSGSFCDKYPIRYAILHLDSDSGADIIVEDL